MSDADGEQAGHASDSTNDGAAHAYSEGSTSHVDADHGSGHFEGTRCGLVREGMQETGAGRGDPFSFDLLEGAGAFLFVGVNVLLFAVLAGFVVFRKRRHFSARASTSLSTRT